MVTKIIMLLAVATAIINPNCELGYPMVFKPSTYTGDFKFVAFDVNPLNSDQILIGGQSFDKNSIGNTGTTPYATLLLMDVSTDQILFQVAISPTMNVKNGALFPYQVCEVKYAADGLTAFIATCNTDSSGTFDRGSPQGRIHIVNAITGIILQTFSFQDALSTSNTLKYKVVSPLTANYISDSTYLYFWAEDTQIFGSGSMMVGDGCCITDAPRLFQMPIASDGLFDTSKAWNQFTLTNTIDSNQDQSITSMIALSTASNQFAFAGYDIDNVAGTQHMPFIGIFQHNAVIATPTKQFYDQGTTVGYLPSQLGYFNGLASGQGEYLFGCLKFTSNTKQAKFQRLSFPNGVLSQTGMITLVYSYAFPQEYQNLAVYGLSPIISYYYGQYDGKGFSNYRMVGILSVIDFGQGKMTHQEITQLNSLTTLQYQPWFNSAKILSPTLGYSVGFLMTVTSAASNNQLTTTAPLISQSYTYNVPFLSSVNIAQQCLTQSYVIATLPTISPQTINMAKSNRFTLSYVWIPSTSVVNQSTVFSSPFQNNMQVLQTIEDMSWCIDPTQMWIDSSGTTTTASTTPKSYTVNSGDLPITLLAYVPNNLSTCIAIQNIFTNSLPGSTYTAAQAVTSTQTTVPIVITMQPFSPSVDTTMTFIMTNVVDPSVDQTSTVLTVTATTWYGHPGFILTQTINFFATPITVPPNIPAAPITTISGTSITISWIAPVNGGSAITGYTVAIQQNDGTTLTTYASCSVSTTSCTIPLSDLQAAPYNLAAGASVFATVIATNNVGDSAASAPGNGAMLPPTVVSPPPAPVVIPTPVVVIPPVVYLPVEIPVVETIGIPQIVKILQSNYYAPNIDPPQFSNVISKTIILQTGDGQGSIQIGIKPDNATVVYELNSATIFCSLKVINNVVYLEVSDPIPVELAGSYSIKIVVVELKLKTTYPITINVTYSAQDYEHAVQKQNEQQLEGAIRKNPDLKQPEMSIKSIDTSANVALKFDQNMVFNNSTMDKINESRIPSKITGLLPPQIIKLAIISAPSYLLKNEFKFDWNVTEVNNKTNTISIKLYFKNPILISQEPERDKLKATIMQAECFVSTLMVEAALYQFDKFDIPRQIPQDQQEILDKMSSITQIGVETAIATSVALNIIFKGPLNFILGMIGSLQIICYLTLINVAFPPNAVVLYSVLQSLALFDILPSDQISEALFVFDSGPAQSAAFYEAGFETLTLILNNGTAFYSLIFLLAQYLVLFIFWVLTKVYRLHICVFKIYLWLQKKLFWSSFITYFMQCYSGMHMAVMLNSGWMAGEAGFGDNLSLAITYVLFIPLNLQAPLLLAFLLRNYEHFEEPNFKAKYSALYGQLKKGKAYLGYPIMLVLRRQLFNMTCLYCMQYPQIQIIALMYQSTAILIYIGYFKPQELGNELEFFNEAAILLTLYTLMLYTDFVPDPDVRYNVVGTYIALPLAFSHIGVNLVIILINTIRNLVWEVKKRWYTARNKKIIAAKQKEDFIKKSQVQPVQVVEVEKITNFSFNNLSKDYEPRRARFIRSPRTTDKLVEDQVQAADSQSVPEEFKIDLPKMAFNNKFNAKRTLIQRTLAASVPQEVLTTSQIEAAEKKMRNSRAASDEIVTRFQQEKTRPMFNSLNSKDKSYALKPSINQRRNGSLQNQQHVVSHSQSNSLLRFNQKEEVTIERAGMGNLQISFDDWQKIQRGAKINIKRRTRNGILGNVGSQIAMN